MKYRDLQKGYRITYKFIQDEKMKFAESPVLTEKEMELRIKEMLEDKNIQEITVLVVRYVKKM